ncbi:MAG: hypothetical protein JWQ25_2533 [Daejeonella sp.]|nr:hypothetical protein [Daejeonella sp.]
MELTITTPALLFPAISLLLLAFTNRFIVIANLLRTLKVQYQEHPNSNILSQLSNLKRRILLIRYMQAFGISSFFFCVFAMFLLFWEQILPAKIVFGSSLVLLMISLYLSFREIHISVNALNLELGDLQNLMKENEEKERIVRKSH